MANEPSPRAPRDLSAREYVDQENRENRAVVERLKAWLLETDVRIRSRDITRTQRGRLIHAVREVCTAVGWAVADYREWEI